MESVAHSRQPNKASVAFSKKIPNGNSSNGFFSSAKPVYDDVYGTTTTTLSPRFEDYGEIFASFHTARASSIPLLDLPAVEDSEVFFDLQSAAFDYSEVFGGFDGLDFSVSYENLLRQPHGADGVSEEETAWTPVETDSLSGDSDHFGSNQGLSNGNLFQSIDGGTEFNISYHKVNGTSSGEMSERKIQISELHTVPGFIHVFDETTHLQATDPSLQVVDDIDLDMEFNSGRVKQKHLRKTVSHPCNFTSAEETLGNDRNLHNGCSRNGSHPGEMFVTVTDINLRTLPSQVPPPSRPPPLLDTKKGNTSGFDSRDEQVGSDKTPGDSSPPFFDVEVDMNSSTAPTKEQMHRPESKLRSVKELEERKKGFFDSNVKSSYEAKMGGNITRLNTLNDEGMQATCDQKSGKIKTRAADEKKKPRKAAQEALESLEEERLANKLEEKHIKESRSSQESDRSTGVGMWKEATEFFELVGTEVSGRVIQPTNHTSSSVQNTETYEHGRKEREASNVQEECKYVKAIEVNHHLEQYKKKSKAAASNVERKQREHVKKDKMTETLDQEENEKKARMFYQGGKIEKKVTDVDQSGSSKDLSERQYKERELLANEKLKEIDRLALSEVQWRIKLKENENNKLKEDEEQQLSVKRHTQSQKIGVNGKFQRDAFVPGAADGEKKVKDSVELEGSDERSSDAFWPDNPEKNVACERRNEILKQANQIHCKKGVKEAYEIKEIEKSQKGSFKREESDESQELALGQVQNEKVLKADFELEINEERIEEAFKQGVREACESDQGEDISNEDSHWEQSEKILKSANQRKKIDRLDKALDKMEGDGEWISMKFGKETDETSETESDENILEAQSPSIHDENIVTPEVFQEPIADQETEKTSTECKVGEKRSEDAGEENLMANREKGASKIAPGDTKHAEVQSGKVNASVTNADQLGLGSERTCPENTKTDSQMEFIHNSQQRRSAHEWGERGNINQHVKVALNHEESTNEMSTSQSNLCGDYRRNTILDEPATVQEAENVQKTSQRSHIAQFTKRKEKSLGETPASVEKDAERMRRERELEKDHLSNIEEEMEREMERKKDRMAIDRAIMEAEREREREKDRMAVDRATFEARDRAYAEARDRAERAAFDRTTAEARQRALAEARERLEKACAEARDKSFADKATAEARLKAERAAVERATAEARERAMEKVKVQRAVYETRERLERSVSDKFGMPFRNDGRQGSSSSDMLDPHFQNFSSSTGSRYPYSSVYGASSFSERSEGESAQRCRARLERYRRTAERAAKALEEKNMRDLLAQKEQAERNRLAETLDAEVRRWSSGKEGNLRALISTLQYILGPDSGWQPIPLTEVITSAAVKKAYRKATLCVHPDKLQQRGASIQHKYVCEKVFDLLKEAWNRFNSEER